jgi:hypothetical protein
MSFFDSHLCKIMLEPKLLLGGNLSKCISKESMCKSNVMNLVINHVMYTATM